MMIIVSIIGITKIYLMKKIFEEFVHVHKIDKHRPSKLGLEGLTYGTILCWFHIMQTLSNHLNEWKIPQQFR